MISFTYHFKNFPHPKYPPRKKISKGKEDKTDPKPGLKPFKHSKYCFYRFRTGAGNEKENREFLESAFSLRWMCRTARLLRGIKLMSASVIILLFLCSSLKMKKP